VQHVSLTLVWHCKCTPSFNLKHLAAQSRYAVNERNLLKRARIVAGVVHRPTIVYQLEDKRVLGLGAKKQTMAVRSKVRISLEQPLCWGGARGVAHNDGKRQSQLLLLLWRAHL
jgi:hypothetical protein